MQAYHDGQYVKAEHNGVRLTGRVVLEHTRHGLVAIRSNDDTGRIRRYPESEVRPV